MCGPLGVFGLKAYRVWVKAVEVRDSRGSELKVDRVYRPSRI